MSQRGYKKSQKIATLQQMYSNALLHAGIQIRALYRVNFVTVNMKRSTEVAAISKGQYLL
jgi:hypothetical protein